MLHAIRPAVKVYLSGPMYLGKFEAFTWRKDVKRILKNWMESPANDHYVLFDVLDPCDRWYDDYGLLQRVGNYVVQMDKMEIEKSHVLLVNTTNPGWGTPMEQYIAFTSGKMVIAFNDSKRALAGKKPSIWAIAHSHHMLKNHVEAAEFLCSIAKDLVKAV